MPRQQPLTGEFDLIEAIRRAFADVPAAAVTLGIGDDCAILQPPRNRELVVTTDLLLEGRHFRRDLHSANSAGHRCLARGLSDIAAMGAEPLAAFLSLALPPTTLADAVSRRWLRRFLAGMLTLAERVPVPLAGGDAGQSAAEQLMADIVLVGSVPRGKAMRRSLARPGDLLYVTGSLGGAAAELDQMLRAETPATRDARTANARKSTPPNTRGPHLRSAPRPPGESPQQFPEPRLAQGVALRRLGVRAAIDLSDGLSSDLAHLARASAVRAVVDAAALPLHRLLRGESSETALRLALHGGEDYELLFAAPPHLELPGSLAGVPITPIGHLEAAALRRPLVTLRSATGRSEALQPGGWQHFTTAGRSPRAPRSTRRPGS